MSPATPHMIDEYESLLVALQEVLGVVVPDGKRKQLSAGLTPLLSIHNLASFDELAAKLLERQPDLVADVLDAITRCSSGWNFSEDIKKLLHKYILARLPENARIWVVGCGRGQLAYSVAMEIANHERISGKSNNMQIIASDIPADDIKSGEPGIYSNIQVADLGEDYKRVYLTQVDGKNWQMKEKVRQRVKFMPADLTKNFQHLGHMDLIICPDVLVYFSNGVKASVLSQFSSLLKPGGILLTGNDQIHLPAVSGFERVDHPAGTFYRQRI